MSGTIGVGTPATTTTRGVGRLATTADLAEGVTVNHGPALLAAGIHTSVSAAAGKVPIADAKGQIDVGWLPKDAINAALNHTAIGGVTVAIGATSETFKAPINGDLNIAISNCGGPANLDVLNATTGARDGGNIPNGSSYATVEVHENDVIQIWYSLNGGWFAMHSIFPRVGI